MHGSVKDSVRFRWGFGQDGQGLPKVLRKSQPVQSVSVKKGDAVAFQDDAYGLLARAHLTDVPKPVLVGGILLAVGLCAALIIQGYALFGRELEVVPSEATSDPAPSVSQDESASDGSGGHDVKEDEVPVCVVHVAGAVAAPGVYSLPEGARIAEAVELAGGFSEDASIDSVNLAQRIADGERIYIPTSEEVEGSLTSGVPAAVGSSPGSAAGSKVNLNAATVDELDALPGVGPSTAQKIVADREANGPFASVEDLMRVSGIGEKKFAELKDRVIV